MIEHFGQNLESERIHNVESSTLSVRIYMPKTKYSFRFIKL
jgi:hypothetical protein